MRARTIVTGALIGAAIATLGAGCYAPDLRDCSVTCSEPADCADDHVCTTDGYCAAEGVRCEPAIADAATTASVRLTVRVDGTGLVVVHGVGDCDDSECTFEAPRTTIHLTAQPIDPHKPFDKWTTDNCRGDDHEHEKDPTCILTPTLSTIVVAARFK